MPVQGSVPRTAQEQVVPPFQETVKEALALIDQPPEQQEKDKRFLKDGKPAAVTGNGLDVLNSCLSAGTVMSFLAGPGGIVLASGIVLFQGLLGVATHPNPNDILSAMETALKKVSTDERTQAKLAKVSSIANMINTQWKDFVDDPRPSAESEKNVIDRQLVIETSTEGDSLANTLFQMEDLLEWDNTDVRVCVLASLTYLFMLWNLQCRIYASLCVIEAKKDADKFNSEHYETFVTTFRIRVQKMRNELNARTIKLRGIYDKMKQDRINQAHWIGVERFPGNAGIIDNSWTQVRYEDKYNGTQYVEKVDPGWLHLSLDSNTETMRVEKENEFNTYRTDLEDFATRSIANDLVVVDMWADIVKEAEQLLRPHAPRVPPTVNSYQPTEKSKVHKYIEDAHWVSYAYSVGTELDGNSAPSPWTDWIELKVDKQGKVQLPVLTLQDSEQVDETRRVVYHRKSTDAAPAPARLEQTAQGQMLEEWKAEEITAKGAVLWVEP
ncbi:hypothetical protein CEP51_000349 [Fusarium floridanum]|uniref:Uncharacterized protein n=1 Tax=Fusarium floridanum TaxID=1325733 RepID=A0A428SN44_9HYPO|nr:hypothetical protein CEP51_000349 [Fusarium floridanum]